MEKKYIVMVGFYDDESEEILNYVAGDFYDYKEAVKCLCKYSQAVIIPVCIKRNSIREVEKEKLK